MNKINNYYAITASNETIADVIVYKWNTNREACLSLAKDRWYLATEVSKVNSHYANHGNFIYCLKFFDKAIAEEVMNYLNK